jgi:hypothetical protein
MRFSVPLFGLTLLMPPALVRFPPAREYFSLALSTMQESVSTGSEIRLTIKLTNQTNHVISLIDMDQRCDFRVEVRNSRGQPVRETEQKHRFKCADPVAGKVIQIILKPGEQREYLLFLNDLYDMTSPDEYLAEVYRQIPKEMGDGRVKSNTITLRVTK